MPAPKGPNRKKGMRTQVVLVSGDQYDIEGKLNRILAEGWEPVGGPAISVNGYYTVMVSKKMKVYI